MRHAAWRPLAAPAPAERPIWRSASRIGIALFLAAPGFSIAQQQGEGSWLGRRVVQKSSDFALRIEDQIVDRRRFILFYRVEKVNGPWLWLNDEGKGVSGWVKADQVVAFEEANSFFSERIRANREDAFAYVMRAAIYQERKQLDSALVDYAVAIKLDPTHAWVYNNRGIAWTDKDEYDKAIADYTRAIAIDPDGAEVLYRRGLAWREMKQYAKAIADFELPVRANPRLDEAYAADAWLRITCPDPTYRDAKRAVESAMRACKLMDWKDPYALSTLAAAYTAAQDFTSASHWHKVAAELAAGAKDDKNRTRVKR
jgi:tetratricopeptide (TPR) repeat protein